MKKNIKKLVLFTILFTYKLSAFQIVNDIAVRVDGYEIPIKIRIPKNKQTKSPVYFFVHGGGWNGGDATKVPKASIKPDANFLSDKLGIIYVGLAYRCKGNNATFADAISDLEASVEWFFKRAEKFNADISRIDFGGSSAGSTLSSIMAQKYVDCKVYIGAEGMYNLVDHSEKRSPFPNQIARKKYGLDTEYKSKAASAYYNLRKHPPEILLLHGDEDALCHCAQSIKFAEKIESLGGEAEVLLHKKINHTCLHPLIPDVFKESTLAIARLFIRGFKLDNNIESVKQHLEKGLQYQYPDMELTENKLLGSWIKKNVKVTFQNNGIGFQENLKNGKKLNFTYSLLNYQIVIILKESLRKRTFVLRKSNQFIYELITKGKGRYRRLNFKKI